MTLRVFVPLCIAWLAVPQAKCAEGFVDPAPPRTRELAVMALPAPQAQAGLKFNAAPKRLASGAITHDWNAFLGPAHNAISAETHLLKKFGTNGPAKVWEVPKGQGYATPAVMGERLVMFHRLANEEVVECLQAETGKRFWRVSYPTAYRDRYGFSGGPRCQPVSDGELVYTFGAEGKLHCLKLTTGQVLWERDIVQEFKLEQNFFGVGSTPLLEGNLLIVNVGAEAGPCVAAFDKRTGKMVWGAGADWGPSYASPIPATTFGNRRVFVFAGGESEPPTGGLLSLDPTNGTVDFFYDWRSNVNESVNASSPLIVGNQVFIAECYGKGSLLLDLKPDGDFNKVWNNFSLLTHFMTALHQDGYLYGIDGHGPQNAPLVCVELKTGKRMWDTLPEWFEPLPGPARGPRLAKLTPGLASLILVDGRCLMLGQFGQLFWLDLNPKGYKELDRTTLFIADETWSMPALSRGLLYVNQNEPAMDGTPPRLICYDLRGE